jgi:sugar phosphate isomerase/epimerase
MNCTRRQFIVGAAAAGLPVLSGPARAMDPIRRKGEPRMKLSLAGYSFRDYLSGSKKSMSYEDFIDLAAGYPLDAIEPTSYYFPEPVTAEYLQRFRRRAFLLGLDISGTAVGNTFTHAPGPQLEKEIAHVKKWVDHSVALGAPVIRIFAGNLPKGTAEPDARKRAVDAIQQCCEYAAQHGIFLALENHGGIVTTAEQTLAIVKDVRSDWFGVNLDTGNFHGPDPYRELEQVAPYAVNVQIKTEISVANGPRGEADMGRQIDILKKVGYRGYVALEYEGKEDPKIAVPRYLATLRKLIS